ncbi:hypothetical protein KI387_003162, partial [Taxus chinensis]
VVNLAILEDPENPLLRKWIKSYANPILIPPQGIGLTDFRDPTTGWYDEEGIEHQVLGTGTWECVDFYP